MAALQPLLLADAANIASDKAQLRELAQDARCNRLRIAVFQLGGQEIGA